MRTRNCTDPAPEYGGKPCAVGKTTMACNTRHCPIDGHWAAWSSCDVSCGGGMRTRNCTNPAPEYGGKPCTGASAKGPCNAQQCPIEVPWILGSVVAVGVFVAAATTATIAILRKQRKQERPLADLRRPLVSTGPDNAEPWRDMRRQYARKAGEGLTVQLTAATFTVCEQRCHLG